MKSGMDGLRSVLGVVTGALFVWAGTRVAAANVPLALLMIAIGAATVVLALRMAIGDRAADERLEATGELSTPHFDYLIWTALIVPMLLIGALLIMAMTGALASK